MENLALDITRRAWEEVITKSVDDVRDFLKLIFLYFPHSVASDQIECLYYYDIMRMSDQLIKKFTQSNGPPNLLAAVPPWVVFKTHIKKPTIPVFDDIGSNMEDQHIHRMLRFARVFYGNPQTTTIGSFALQSPVPWLLPPPPRGFRHPSHDPQIWK